MNVERREILSIWKEERETRSLWVCAVRDDTIWGWIDTLPFCILHYYKRERQL